MSMYSYFSNFGAKKCYLMSTNDHYQMFYIFINGRQSLTSVGGGQGSLICHVTKFEQYDWLRSTNFINMIEYISIPYLH